MFLSRIRFNFCRIRRNKGVFFLLHANPIFTNFFHVLTLTPQTCKSKKFATSPTLPLKAQPNRYLVVIHKIAVLNIYLNRRLTLQGYYLGLKFSFIKEDNLPSQVSVQPLIKFTNSSRLLVSVRTFTSALSCTLLNNLLSAYPILKFIATIIPDVKTPLSMSPNIG